MNSTSRTVAQGCLRLLYVFAVAASLCGRLPAKPAPTGANSPLDALDAQQIPTTERFPWQAKELVAVIGSHRWQHWGRPNSVAFSPDGTTVASGGWDCVVRLWDNDGRELAALNLGNGTVNAVAFKPDGWILLAGAEDGMIHAWDLRAKPPTPLPPLKPSELPRGRFDPNRPDGSVDAIAFAPGGKLLACSIGRQTNVRVVLWDATTWPPRELPGLPGAFAPFAFGPDGKTLVTQEQSGNIIVWDVTGDRPSKTATGRLREPRNQMLTMALAPDGKTLVTCHGDTGIGGRFIMPGDPVGDVILWDITQAPLIPKAVFGSFKGDPMFFMTAAAAFLPDGKSLAFAARNRSAELWDVAANPPKRRAVLPGNVGQTGSLAVGPDGKTLASVGAGVLLWDLTDPTPRLKTARPAIIRSAVISPDGRRLASAEDGTKEFTIATRLWDLTGTAPHPWSETIEGIPLLFAADGVLLTADNPSKEALAESRTAEPARPMPLALRRWDLSGKAPRTVGAATAPAMQLARRWNSIVTAQNRLFFDKTEEGQRSLCRLGSGGEVKSWTLPVPRESVVHPAAASADGAVLAAGVGDYSNRVIKVWDIGGDTVRERASFKGAAVPTRSVAQEKATGKITDGGPGEDRPLNVWALALPPDGRAIALADLDGTIQLWDLTEKAPKLRATLSGHTTERVMGAVQHLAFSGDGHRLVTVGSERKLIVWDTAAGKEVYSAIFPNPPNDAAFAPDGRHVVTNNPDGTVYILRPLPAP